MSLRALWWWIDRWRKSTAYTDMTLSEQGAYRNLLDEAHLRGGAIPNNERVLARACGDPVAWTDVRTAVMARFELRPDGWHNSTLDAVLRESTRRADKQRAYRERLGNASGNEAGNAGGSPSPSPSPSPDPSPEKEQERSTRAPVLSARAKTTSGVMAGSLPRDHLNCRPPCERVCVSEKLHAVLRGRYGSDPDAADKALDAFYADVRARLPDEPIGLRPWEFWEQQFTARFGGAKVSQRTMGNIASAQLWLSKTRGKPS